MNLLAIPIGFWAWFFDRYEPVVFWGVVLLLALGFLRLMLRLLKDYGLMLVGFLKAVWLAYVDFKIQKALMVSELSPYFDMTDKLLSETIPDRNPEVLVKRIDRMRRKLENKKRVVLERDSAKAIGANLDDGFFHEAASSFRDERSAR